MFNQFNERSKIMDSSQKKKFKKMVEKDCKQMRNNYVVNWSALCLYLEKEVSEGKREFRIAFKDDKKFIIHPLGKDGNTIDMSID